MKNIQILSVIIFVIITGICSQFESTAQDQLTKIQLDNLKFYQQREMAASPKIKANLQSLREQIQAKKYSFQVGYTTAMEYSIEQITGLVVPSDLDEQIKKQNESAKKMMRMQSATLGTCSATASSFDWRKNNGTTPVRDQKACGSCWAFATCGAYEGNYRIINSKASNCSEQHILDCNPWGYSCNGGWWAFQYFIDNGVAKEFDYPYTAVKGTCKSSVTVPYKAEAWGYVSSGADIPSTTLIKRALCQHGPLSVAVLVTPLFQAYTSGVLDEPASPDDGINHGVTLIGWDDTKNAWLIKNSWGTGWGDTCGYGTEKGFMWITYTSLNIGYAAAWVQVGECHGCNCP